jgi:hypothetical protein
VALCEIVRFRLCEPFPFHFLTPQALGQPGNRSEFVQRPSLPQTAASRGLRAIAIIKEVRSTHVKSTGSGAALCTGPLALVLFANHLHAAAAAAQAAGQEDTVIHRYRGLAVSTAITRKLSITLSVWQQCAACLLARGMRGIIQC